MPVFRSLRRPLLFPLPCRHQGSLVEHQEQLLSRHQGLTERVSYNLQQLTQEKTLIHAGQEQLTNMTQDIRNQLGEDAFGRVRTSIFS